MERINEEASLRTRSLEVQDIMSYTPIWIVRWGIATIFMALVSLLFLSWLIKYPEVVEAKLILTSNPPPIRVFAQSNGRMIDLLTKDQSYVKAGTYLAVIENSANTKDVFELEKIIDSLDLGSISVSDNSSIIKWANSPQLGELQDVFTNFVQSLEAIKIDKVSSVYRSRNNETLQQQIKELEKLNLNVQEQIKIIEKDLAIAENNFQINKQLLDSQAISRVNFERIEETYLQKKLSLERAKSTIHNNVIQQNNIRNSVSTLDLSDFDKQETLRLQLENSYKNLISNLASWKNRYLIIAPIEGQVSFFEFWSANQYIKAGEEMFSIIPQYTEVIGKAFLSETGSGKVKLNQQVNIMLDNYNYQEFGMLVGKVENISTVPKRNEYIATIKLKDGLTTSYNKKLDFRTETQGQAEIITEDIRLIERIFFNLRKVTRYL